MNRDHAGLKLRRVLPIHIPMDSTALVVLIVSGGVGLVTLSVGAVWLSRSGLPRKARHAQTSDARRTPLRYGSSDPPVLHDAMPAKTVAVTPARLAARDLVERAITSAAATSKDARAAHGDRAYASTLPMEHAASNFAATDFRTTSFKPTDWPATEPVSVSVSESVSASVSACENTPYFAATEPMPLDSR